MRCDEKVRPSRTFADEDGAGPEGWIPRSQADEDTVGACLFESSAIDKNRGRGLWPGQLMVCCARTVSQHQLSLLGRPRAHLQLSQELLFSQRGQGACPEGRHGGWWWVRPVQ